MGIGTDGSADELFFIPTFFSKTFCLESMNVCSTVQPKKGLWNEVDEHELQNECGWWNNSET